MSLPPLPQSLPPENTASPQRILIVQPNWVGDAVMALGGLREVRRIVGDARLTVAARPWVAGIFEESGVVDEVIPLETLRLGLRGDTLKEVLLGNQPAIAD